MILTARPAPAPAPPRRPPTVVTGPRILGAPQLVRDPQVGVGGRIGRPVRRTGHVRPGPTARDSGARALRPRVTTARRGPTLPSRAAWVGAFALAIRARVAAAVGSGRALVIGPSSAWVGAFALAIRPDVAAAVGSGRALVIGPSSAWVGAFALAIRPDVA
ncbi:hypothetical protein ACFZB4_25265, partial [Streptomyces pseudovenezuelae]